MELIRLPSSIAWELRGHWARGFRVSLVIAGDERRIEGFVDSVSSTDAYVVVSGLHAPLERVVSVHRPSRLGDSTFDEDGREGWSGRIPPGARKDPRQLEIPGL